MAVTAFVVRVPSAEVLVSELRERHDSTFYRGVPAHITILVPFMDPAQVTTAVLTKAREALMEVSAFEFSLRRVEHFPTTAYLAPEPPSPFVAMTSALVRVFPEFPPYGGEHASVVPHLTVAHGNAESAARGAVELEGKMLITGTIAPWCSSVVLLENSSGYWKELHEFNLPSSVKL